MSQLSFEVMVDVEVEIIKKNVDVACLGRPLQVRVIIETYVYSIMGTIGDSIEDISKQFIAIEGKGG